MVAVTVNHCLKKKNDGYRNYSKQQCLVLVNTDYGPVPATNAFRVTSRSILPTALQAWTEVGRGRLPEAQCKEVFTVGAVRRERPLKQGTLVPLGPNRALGVLWGWRTHNYVNLL